MASGRPVVAVAYSGGKDSTALLHATVKAAAPLGIAVLALHVHHGLSAHADDWLAHGDQACRRLRRRGHDVAFRARRLDSFPCAGESVEAWARQARYRALRSMAEEGGADLVLLAHHRRDQAETFLLQALRKGGVAALSAMPAAARREGITWARPWLAQSHEAVEAYLRRHRLKAIEDDSNADLRFARNRIRTSVWPALLAGFTDAEETLAAAATWAQQASAVLDEVADADLAAVADDRGLDVAAWRCLSPARQGSALRRWVLRQSGGSAPASLVERLLVELDPRRSRRWPAPGGQLYSYRGALRWRPGTALLSSPDAVPLDAARPGVRVVSSWRGSLLVELVERGGCRLDVAAGLMVRRRAPTDRFQAGPARPARRLKLQYQAAGVGSADRDTPVFSSGDTLVYVPGLGIDARALAADGEPQVAFSWVPTVETAGRAG